jgi:hypothetical protein
MKCLFRSVALVIITSAAAFAQQAPVIDPAIAEKRISLSIDAMPIDELPPILDKALGVPVNLIIPPEASGVILPRLKLHQITVPELFEALQMASSPSGAEPLYRFEPASGNIWIFKTTIVPAGPGAQAQTAVQVFALEPYLKNLKVEDVTTAIETAAQTGSSHERKPNLKFHEETKLLIASGSPEQLGVVQSVLTALSSSVQSKQEKETATALENARAQLKSQAVTAEVKLEAVQQENKRLEARAAELEARNAKMESDMVRLRAELELETRKVKN